MNKLDPKVIEAMISNFKNTDKTETHEQTDETTGIANKRNRWNLFVILNAEKKSSFLAIGNNLNEINVLYCSCVNSERILSIFGSGVLK
jgi:hypothetical protein